MRFVLYTEKTVAQCMAAVNERLHARATSSRPRMDGWVDKNGSFSIGVQTKVLGRFDRRTYLVAKAERQSGVTTVKGTVADGASPREMLFVFLGLALVALLLGSETPLLGMIILPFAALLYIPLRGDRVNREILLAEVKRILKARSTPPKTKASARRSASTARTAAGASAALAARPPSRASASTEDDDDDLPDDEPEDEDS